jgi:dUTP pyrophosphatase
MDLQIQRVDKGLELPKQHRDGDAALDLRSAEEKTISPGEYATLRTGIKMAIPLGHVGLIWDRGGMAAKGLTTMGGVIDSNYRGEIQIIIVNHGKEPFPITKGMRIAQIIIQPISDISVKEVDELDETNRGEDRFGSSGTH